MDETKIIACEERLRTAMLSSNVEVLDEPNSVIHVFGSIVLGNGKLSQVIVVPFSHRR